MVENKIIEYKLTGKIVPKARPRISNGRAFMPANYRDWKDDAIFQLRQQCNQVAPIEKCQLEIEIGGKQRGDLDNIAGSIMDAMVQAGILTDDRISLVSKLTIEYFSDRQFGTLIKIEY